MFRTKFLFDLIGADPVTQEYEHNVTPQKFIDQWIREGGLWDHEQRNGSPSRFIPWHSIFAVEILSHEQIEGPSGEQ
jgi:hypothetical protein